MAAPHVFRLIGLLPAVAVLACGGKSDDGRGAFFAAKCDAYAPCCASAGLPTNAAQCRAVVGAVPANAMFDKAAGDQCVSALGALTSQAAFCTGTMPEPEPCGRVFVLPPGTTAPGGTCVDDSSCAPSSAGDVHCVSLFGGGAPVKKCQVQMRGQSGATPCSATVEGGDLSYVTAAGATDVPAQAFVCHVDDGLRCDGTACVALKQLNDACQTMDECARTTYCDFGLGVCTAFKQPGDACTSSAQCLAGNYCNATQGLCAPQLDVGASCGDDTTACLSGNCAAGVCAPLITNGVAALCGGTSS